jgi:hypothetical protein
METAFAAAMLTQPVALIILAFVVVCSVLLGAHYSPSPALLSRRRLAGGLLGVFVASLLIAVAASYATPEEARRFGVELEYYAAALWHEFVTAAAVLAYISLFGCAIVGVPVALLLAKRNFATAPVLIAVSVPISLVVFALMLLLVGNANHVARDASMIVGLHVALALGFVLGARLPWRMKHEPRDEA